ncbi:unnamed protein product [Calicophoron daubneyi]
MVKLSVSLLCKSTSNLKRRKIDETPEQYLKQITHVYLNGKHLEDVGHEIFLCKSLKVLYLYENLLKEVPELSCLSQLTHLYLQNNNIERIERLSELKNLQKLFLSRNRITVVEGLEGLTSLQELRVDHQHLQPGEYLLFDERSIAAISETLNRLDVSGNGLETLEDLVPLRSLVYLYASNNQIGSVTTLIACLANWPELKELELQGNPVLNKPRAKDAIIVSTKSLEVLDEKPIPVPTRKFLESWNQCRGIRVLASALEAPVRTISTSQNSEISVLGIPEDARSAKVLQLTELSNEPQSGEHTVTSEDVEFKAPLQKKLEENGSVDWISCPLTLPSTEIVAPSDRGEAR